MKNRGSDSGSGLDRRHFLALAGGVLGTAPFWARPVLAQDTQPRAPTPSLPQGFRHGLSAFGDLKYPADFAHFDYVDPNAPRGGTLSYTPGQWALNQNPNTFNTLNTLILTGDAPVGLEGIFATLMTRALDEPDAVYGFAASEVSIEENGKLYRFRLRPEARFDDGSKLTADDVVFSILTLKADGHPILAQQLVEVVGAEVGEPGEVLVRFSGKQARDIPLVVATLPIISEAYYSKHDFKTPTMDLPLGSAAYKVGSFTPGRTITYERTPNWWGETLPAFRGQNNFDAIRLEFFRDRQVALEGFKAGAYRLREEFTSRVWARGYDFPAVKEKRVVRFELPDGRPSGAQGWWINTRRARFSDPRVREALILAFDFEWTNANLMFGSYSRTASPFENSPLKAEGPPSPDELALLEPWRGKVTDEIFGEPFSPPKSDGSGQDRKLLRRAAGLLREAGFAVKDGALRDAQGNAFSLEILDHDSAFEPHAQAYIKNLRILGIQGSFRVVDAAQFQARQNSFDFDLMPRRWAFSSTPGDGLRLFFGSRSADVPGSYNLAGIKSEALDAMIEKVIAAQTRPEMTTAARCVDRLFRAGRYWVPHWYKPTHWMATWDMFGRPAVQPTYGLPFDTTWWIDRDKATRAGIPL